MPEPGRWPAFNPREIPDLMTVAQAFELAVQHHQSGRLAEAETLYRKILAVDSRHADCLHLLGVIAHQMGRNDIAVDLNRQAITQNPTAPDFHSHLGEVYRALGRIEEAIAACRQAIGLRPDHAAAHTHLGNAFHDRGMFDAAIDAYRQAVTLRPTSPEAHNNLGSALKNRQNLAEASAAYRQAIALRPDYADAWSNLGLALLDHGQPDEAVAACRRAIALRPHFPAAHFHLGNALRAGGKFDEAIAAYRQALALRPTYAEAANNLGNTLEQQGRLGEAIAAYRQAIALRPGQALAHSNLGNALWENGQLPEAIAACRQAIVCDPRCAEAHANLGNALKDHGQLDEALAAYRQALAIRPDYPEALNSLGNALKDSGQLDEALAAFRQAITLRPGFLEAHSNLVYALHFHPGWDAQAIAGEHRHWNEQHAEPLRRFIAPHGNDPNPGRRLRLGYVSPDFCRHVVGYNLLPLLTRHDSRQFEIFCYAQVARPDSLTDRFRASAHQWRNTLGLSHEQLTAQIRADQIDILVDLTMHMGRHRLPVFARRPAPVQVTFAAYLGSTGLSTIDYRFSDPFLDPAESDESIYSEQTVRLPHSFWCYDPADADDVIVNDLPASTGQGVTFGCLNNFCKVNEPGLRLWARVLQAVPASRLLLLAPEGAHRERVREVVAQEGIAGSRLEFLSPRPRRQYLELYHRVDLGLDTLPYNGHTTSLDSAWMGVPVVTLVGQTIAGRAGLSQLMNLGLPELIASSPEDFVRIAAALALDLPRLADLRRTLRPRLAGSPLMDAPRFARAIESAYRHMWQDWCRERQSPQA